jgi:apolipoprotein N-acyltransferase
MDELLTALKSDAFRRVRLAPIASALLLLAAFPPFDLRLLVFVALVPWLRAFPYGSRKEVRQAGLTFGFLFIAGQMAWVGMLTERWVGGLLMAVVPVLTAGLVGMLYFWLLAFLMNRCCRSGRMFLLPLAWAGVEILRAYMPVVAFPWGLISTPLARFPALIGLASFLTIFGVGAWVVTVNIAVAGAIRTRRIPIAATAFSLVGLAVSLLLYSRPISGRDVKVLIGQPGVDMAFTEPVLARAEVATAATSLIETGDAQGDDLIVLPEGICHVPDSTPTNLAFPMPKHAAVLFGAERGRSPAFQSAITWDGAWHVADKTRLVIFGEFVPARAYLPFLDSFKLPSGDLQAGDKVTALKAGTLTVGPMVCFEELFPDVGLHQKWNGSQLLAVISMDDWFRDTPAWEQLRDSCVFRAVETGLPLVRSATTGSSLAIDARGRVIAEAKPGIYSGLEVTVKAP